jgi:hypothetical protein
MASVFRFLPSVCVVVACARTPSAAPHPTTSGPLHQPSGGLPRFRIESRKDLVTALDNRLDPDYALRPAVIALEGRRIAPWLVEILRDRKIPERVQEQALQVLFYTRDSLFVGPLLQIVTKGPPRLLQVRARETLVLFPYTPVCDHWRKMLRNPETPSHEIVSAISGLGYCGSARDEGVLDSIATRGRYEYMRRLATATLERVRRPVAERFHKDIWASAPSPDGAFLPGEQVAAAIQHAACGGPCQEPIVLAPEQPLSALRGR